MFQREPGESLWNVEEVLALETGATDSEEDGGVDAVGRSGDELGFPCWARHDGMCVGGIVISLEVSEIEGR